MASAEPHKEFLLRKSESGPPKLPGKPFVSKRAPISKPPVPRAAELLDAPVVRALLHGSRRHRLTAGAAAGAPGSQFPARKQARRGARQGHDARPRRCSGIARDKVG